MNFIFPGIFMRCIWYIFIGTFLLSSLQGAITVPGGLTHEYTVTSSQIVEGVIPIQNEGDQEIVVNITPADYYFSSQGASEFPSAGTNPRSNTSWIRSSSSQVTIPPHSTFQFSYALHVPSAPSLEGTYWSVFLIEPIELPLQTPKEKQSLGIQTIIRYGVQIITHIAHSGYYDLKITSKELAQQDSLKTLTIHVENTGTRMQAPLFSIELADETGKKVGKFSAAKQRIFPSCSVAYQVDLSSVGKGKYKALVLLDHGEDAFFGAKYDLEIQ